MTWELVYQDSEGERVTQHDKRSGAMAELTEYFIDAGITVASDPTAAQRDATAGGFSAQFDAPDGTRIAYSIRQVKDAARYLNLGQFEERIGVSRGSLSKYRLPEPDAITGPVNDDGSIPRGTVRGWLPETIDEWNAARPGRGARTDRDGT